MSVPREKLLDKADNSIYKLVVLAARRAKEIQAGQPVLLETPESNNLITIALEEIAAGLVRCKKKEKDYKHQASQVAKEEVSTSSSELKMDATFTASEMVDDNEEEEISAGHQEIHSPPEDDYQENGKG